jgi:mannose/fructose/N-acetylgalactosamine-specific phosphotransferase system component IID
MSKLSRKHLMHVGFRLSLLQSTWFEGGMQAIGLSYCLIPGLRVIYPDVDELRAAMERYQAPFNTHPFMAGIIAGCVLRMEEAHTPPEVIMSFARNAMGLLAALGDPFFKSALPTFVSVSACLAAMLGGVVAGVATILIAFNVIHLAVRFIGVSIGYKEGLDVLKRVAGWISPARTALLKRASAVGAGLVLTVAAFRFGNLFESQVWLGIAAAAAGLAIAVVLTVWRKSARFSVPVTLAAVVLAEVLI